MEKAKIKMLYTQTETDQFLIEHLTAKTHWCLMPGPDHHAVVTDIEETFYNGKGDHFIAVLYPFLGTLVSVFLADKSDLSPQDLEALLRRDGAEFPSGALATQDIIFLGTPSEYGVQAAIALITRLDAEKVLLASTIE